MAVNKISVIGGAGNVGSTFASKAVCPNCINVKSKILKISLTARRAICTLYKICPQRQSSGQDEITVYYDGTPLCAMILVNGQSMFSCGANPGVFDLEVPLDGNGEITLYVFCAGFAPYREVLVP